MNGSVDHSINPIEKDKEWISKAIKHYWDDFTSNNGASFFNARNKYSKIKQYMHGMQPVDKYIDQIIPEELASDDLTWLRVNFEVFPIIPKIRRIVLDIVKKLRYATKVEVVDALAMDDQDKYYADIAAKIALREKLKQNGIDPEIVAMKSSDPKDFDELEIHMKYTYKHQAAIEVETALSQVMNENRYDEIRDQVLEDIFDHDVSCVQEYRDYDDELITEHVPLDIAVCSPTDNKYFDDIYYAGKVVEMTPAEVLNNCSDQEKQEFKEFEQSDFASNIQRNSIYQSEKNKYKVLHLEFLSQNNEQYETRIRKDGTKVFGAKSKGKKNKEFHELEYDVVYSGYWIIDSDFFFSCDLDTNMKRDHKDLKRTRLSYHFIASNLFGMSTKSIGEQLIPMADGACMAWYKLQNAVLRAKPKGVMYELSALQSIQTNEEEVSIEENLTMYSLTGNLAYRRVDEDGDVANWTPITEMEGGIGKQGEEFLALIDRYTSYAKDITGLNEITDGSSPDPKMLKSVAQLAQLSTNNAIRFIHETERKLNDRVATDLMIRLLDLAQDDALEGYTKSIGENSVKFFKVTKDMSWRKMGIFHEEEPPQEDKEKLSRRIEIALATPENAGVPQITIEDAHFIETIQNPRMAMEYLAYKVKKNREENEKRIALREERNINEQLKASKSSEEEKRKTAEIEHRFKILEIDRKGEWDLRVKSAEVTGEYQDEIVKAGARDRENIRNNRTKEKLAEKKEKSN